MININLLPWREQYRREATMAFYIALGVTVGITFVVMLIIHFLMANKVDFQKQRNHVLTQEIARYNVQIRVIKDLRKVKQSLITRMDIIQSLQSNRPLTVHLLDEVVNVLPDGIHLYKVMRNNSQLTFEGYSESNTGVSQLMRNIETSQWISQPILSEIKKAQREVDVNNLDDAIVSDLTEKVLKQQEIQTKINQRNNLENEIKIRNTVEYVVDQFSKDPVEGLTAVLVGSNLQKQGSRSSVALAQLSKYRQIATAFTEKLRQKNLTTLFAKANSAIDKKIARTIWELGEGKTITEKNKDIVELSKVIHEFSETLRLEYNKYGANIGKLPGWIVRQSHDPFQLRNAMDVLNLKNNKNIKEINGSVERNLEVVADKDRNKLLTYA